MNRPIKHSAEIRSLNKKKIIAYLRMNDPITKKDLASALDLSFATVSNLCNQLVDDGIINLTSSLSSDGGRVPHLLSIDFSSKYILSINLSYKIHFEISIIDLKNEVIALKKKTITKNYQYDQLLQDIKNFFDTMLSEKKISAKQFIGAGVSVSGIQSPKTDSIINVALPILEGKQLDKDLKSVLKLPVYIENDSNLLVLATKFFGKNNLKNDNLIYLYIGEGIGVGIIANGSVIKGNSGIGGEISHIPIGTRKYKCYCGNENCVESELSFFGFLKKYHEETNNDEMPFTQEEWDNFIEKVLSNDKNANKVIKENGLLLGKFVSILINIFDPESFYIGGITEKIMDKMYPIIIDEVKKRILPYGISDLKIYCSENYLGLMNQGCGELVFNEWRL